ncbi:MAG: inorganic pyrophosphatase [Aristaeellaceae bacterium]
MTGLHPGDAGFWAALDQLTASSRLVIDRPRGTAHPRYPDMIYPLDYGYLQGTTAMDGGGIDVWAGSDPARGLDAIMVTVDLVKRDSEIKLLIGCTEEEKQLVWHQHNDSEFMKGMLIRRPEGFGT